MIRDFGLIMLGVAIQMFINWLVWKLKEKNI
jgi:hypothetical protein